MQNFSGRKVIKEPTTVRVANFKQLTENLGVISYIMREKNVRVTDTYNIDNPETMRVLNLVPAESWNGVHTPVNALLAPDDADSDGHPECLDAKVVA